MQKVDFFSGNSDSDKYVVNHLAHFFQKNVTRFWMITTSIHQDHIGDKEIGNPAPRLALQGHWLYRTDPEDSCIMHFIKRLRLSQLAALDHAILKMLEARR